MEWIEARLYTTHDGVEPVFAMLMDAGVTGIQIEDDEDMACFLQNNKQQWDYIDEKLLNTQNAEACVIFHVSNNACGHETVLSVKNGITRISELGLLGMGLDLGRLALDLTNVNDETWLNEWKKYYKPFKVGKSIVIKPTWEAYTPNKNEIVFNINPGHVFGTGLHQTTQLCIEQLEKHVNATTKLLDLGCGSGILSIIGLLLSAQSAYAVDIDPNAVDIAYENAVLNHIDKNKYTVVSGNILNDQPLICAINQTIYDVVVANIVADVIVAISAFVSGCVKKDGIFITSGIITQRLEDVYAALSENGFTVSETIQKDDWVCVAAIKN